MVAIFHHVRFELYISPCRNSQEEKTNAWIIKHEFVKLMENFS